MPVPVTPMDEGNLEVNRPAWDSEGYMSRSIRKSVALCLFVGCLTAPAFGAPRDGREGGGIFAAIKRVVVHALDQIEIVWPHP